MKKREARKRPKLKQLLDARGITPCALSKRLGYKDERAVYKWIYGIAEPRAAVMLKLTEILDVSAEEILRLFAE